MNKLNVAPQRKQISWNLAIIGTSKNKFILSQPVKLKLNVRMQSLHLSVTAFPCMSKDYDMVFIRLASLVLPETYYKISVNNEICRASSISALMYYTFPPLLYGNNSYNKTRIIGP